MGKPNNTDCLAAGRSLHRLASVRRLEGLSQRTLAWRLNVDVSHVKFQELETSDILLSALYEWQNALKVPVSELLVEPDDPLPPTMLKRAQLVRVMKTVLAIMEKTKQRSVRRLTQRLIEQLAEIMPELKGVSSWQTVGERRSRDEFGVTAERQFSEDVFFLD